MGDMLVKSQRIFELKYADGEYNPQYKVIVDPLSDYLICNVGRGDVASILYDGRKFIYATDDGEAKVYFLNGPISAGVRTRSTDYSIVRILPPLSPDSVPWKDTFSVGHGGFYHELRDRYIFCESLENAEDLHKLLHGRLPWYIRLWVSLVG